MGNFNMEFERPLLVNVTITVVVVVHSDGGDAVIFDLLISTMGRWISMYVCIQVLSFDMSNLAN